MRSDDLYGDHLIYLIILTVSLYQASSTIIQHWGGPEYIEKACSSNLFERG